MATVHGKLQSVTGSKAEQGSVEIALCGYGSFVPRGNDVLVARPTSKQVDVPVDAAGMFTTTVAGNDQIKPPGTYYTVTIKDANGDIVQCNAYLFTGSTDYDLATTAPIDPTGPPPPPVDPINNELQVVGPADDMVFDGSVYSGFQTTLPGNVTQPVFQNMIDGNLYTFIIVQDAVGGHTFAWAANVHNAVMVNPLANAATVQTFVARQGNLYSIAPGTWT